MKSVAVRKEQDLKGADLFYLFSFEDSLSDGKHSGLWRTYLQVYQAAQEEM